MEPEVKVEQAQQPIISNDAVRKLNALAGMGTGKKNSALAELNKQMIAKINSSEPVPAVKDLPAKTDNLSDIVTEAKKSGIPAVNPVAKPEVKIDEAKKPEPGAGLEEEENDELEDFSVDTPLLGKKTFSRKKEETPDETTSFEGVDKYVKSKFKVDDFKSFTKKYTELEQSNKDLSDKLALTDKLEQLIADAPEDLYLAIKKHANGQDWKDHIINAPKIDIAQDVKKLPVEDLVNNYFPGQISAEEWEEYKDPEGDAKTKKMVGVLHNQAVEKFGFDKQKREGLNAEIEATTKKKQELYSSSVTVSMKRLKEDYPELNANKVKHLQQNLSKSVILAKFFDKDGNCLPEAASQLAMLIDGKETIKSLIKVAEDMAKTSANLDILGRGQRKPTIGNGATSGENKGVRPEAVKMINNLVSGLGKRR